MGISFANFVREPARLLTSSRTGAASSGTRRRRLLSSSSLIATQLCLRANRGGVGDVAQLSDVLPCGFRNPGKDGGREVTERQHQRGEDRVRALGDRRHISVLFFDVVD